ncbi:hypothetical protein P7C73_g4271, partial [Tremellales sp. Uapishka_1]
MPVARTPPPHLQKQTAQVQAQAESSNAPKLSLSPSRVFKPSSQVMRSPPPGAPALAHSQLASRPSPPPQDASDEEEPILDIEMEAGPSSSPPRRSPSPRQPVYPPLPTPRSTVTSFDLSSTADTTSTQSLPPHTPAAPTISSQPQKEPQEHPLAQQTPAHLQAVDPSRRKSRSRTPGSQAILSEPAVPIPEPIDPEADYGRHYSELLKVIEVAARKGVNKWTAQDLKDCLPILAQHFPDALDDVYASSAHGIRQLIITNAETLLAHYKAAPGLKRLNEIVREAKEYHRIHPAGDHVLREDAWRADLDPYAITAAVNLPLYDSAYTKLHDEYLSVRLFFSFLCSFDKN